MTKQKLFSIKRTVALGLLITLLFNTMTEGLFALGNYDINSLSKVTFESGSYIPSLANAGNIEKKFEKKAVNKASNNESKILGEDTSKRERNVKHFLKEDMSYEAVVYQQPVHFLKNGKYEDIDNTLLEVVSQSGKSVLQNANNEFKVDISKEADSNELVTLKKGEHKLVWSILKDKDVIETPLSKKNKVEKAMVKLRDEEKKVALKKLSDEQIKQAVPKINQSLVYEDIQQDVNLEYEVNSIGMKENIVLEKYIPDYKISFVYNSDSLVAKLEKDNSINFYDKNDLRKVIFNIPTPIMVDANKKSSKDINISLEILGTDTVVTVEPSKNWLSNKERVFPVKIDPAVNITVDAFSIYDSYVCSGFPDYNFENLEYVGIGNNITDGTNKMYSNFILPSLTPADMVVSSKYYMYMNTADFETTQIDVHRVNSYWNSYTLTWNNAPSYNTKIEDYELVSGSANTKFEWDITSAVKDWYLTGTNHGLLFKTNEEVSSSSTNYFYSAEAYSNMQYMPYVIIGYVNASGIEDYYTYHSQNVGRAGTVFTNDYNGNVVLVHTDVAMTGNRMPITLNHVFNNNEKSADIGYGNGFRTSHSQTINQVYIGEFLYYEYTDGDGTKHYFKSASDTWDESGLNIKLTKNADGTYTVKDKMDNTLKFNTSGLLINITDSNSNGTTIAYLSGTDKPSTITDPSGRVVKLNYVNNVLDNIVDAANRIVAKFTYTSGYLTAITYLDSKISNYAYDTNGNLITVTNYDGYRMSYEYYTGETNRVYRAIEGHTSGTVGESLTMDYGYNTTTFVDSSSRKNTFIFNNEGNTVSIKDNEGNAKYYGYNTMGTSKNKLSLESKLQKTVINLAKDSGVEDNDGSWISAYWTGSTANNSITSAVKYSGNNSLMIQKTNNVSGHCFKQDVTVEKGKDYTFSAYVKTSGVTSTNGKGAVLYAHYQDSTGAWYRGMSRFVNGTKDWSRIDTTISVPSNSAGTTVKIYAVLTDETGIAYFDNLQIEKSSVSNSYNYVMNGDFSNGATGWQSINLDSNDGIVTYTGTDLPKGLSNQVYKMVGSSLAPKSIYKYVNTSGLAGDRFVFSGWAKGQAVGNIDAQFELEIGFVKSDGTYDLYSLKFNQESDEWQYLSAGFTVPYNYSNVYISSNYYYEANTAYFTGFSLFKEGFGSNCTYDANGNKTGTTDTINASTNLTYDTTNNVTQAKDQNNNLSNYTYDTKHNNTSSTSSENVMGSNTYSSHGNVTESKVGDTVTYIRNANTYTTTGNYLESSKDGANNTTSYAYNETKGTLSTVTDAKGKANTYEYDTMDRMTSVSKSVGGATISNSYGYTNDRLSTITHNGFNYNFGYDNLGNNTTVKVGTATLVTNTYESKTSKLLSSVYGNTHKVGYTYDTMDRVTEKKYNDVVKFKYYYDADGNLSRKEDLINNISTKYRYSTEGILQEVTDSTGNNFVYTYDNMGQISKIEDVKRNDTVLYNYNKDGKPTNATKGSTSVNYTYDVVGRLTKKSIVNGTNIFDSNFTYKAGYNGSSTGLVSQISNNGTAITYNYDENNNITSYVMGGKTVAFTYDELNQLIRENNQEINKTITYTYNAGGNITSKKEYTYTTGTVGTETKTYTYVYGDTNWKDKMTSFDGKAVTYDAIGNPSTYDGWTYTWEAGRQLAGMSKTGTTISYKYDDNGIRTSKTVNGVTTTYTLVGDKVAVETSGTDVLKYIYGADVSLLGVNFNGTDYFYVYDVQGDIIGIVNTSKTQVVSYIYDSWGKVTSTTGTMASTLGEKNPYRYRGYRLDSETGMYYLQSRMYCSDWGRFLNADSVIAQGGQLLTTNMFAYCNNNPVNMVDPNGDFAVAAGIYFVPGVGQVALAATGALAIGWMTVSAGSWLYNKIISYISSKTPTPPPPANPNNWKDWNSRGGPNFEFLSKMFITTAALQKAYDIWRQPGVDAFLKAAQKGFVSARASTGITALRGNPLGSLYKYEIKVFGEQANYRIFGYINKAGQYIFDRFGDALH